MQSSDDKTSRCAELRDKLKKLTSDFKAQREVLRVEIAKLNGDPHWERNDLVAELEKVKIKIRANESRRYRNKCEEDALEHEQTSLELRQASIEGELKYLDRAQNASP